MSIKQSPFGIRIVEGQSWHTRSFGANYKAHWVSESICIKAGENSDERATLVHSYKVQRVGIDFSEYPPETISVEELQIRAWDPTVERPAKLDGVWQNCLERELDTNNTVTKAKKGIATYVRTDKRTIEKLQIADESEIATTFQELLSDVELKRRHKSYRVTNIARWLLELIFD